MRILLSILFWGSILALFHTYVFFPFTLWLRTRRQALSSPEKIPEDLFLSILVPAYNEEEVIRQKIENIYQSDFPVSGMEVLIMSDASSDATENIILEAMTHFPNLKFFRTEKRLGKPSLLNTLVTHAKGSVLVLTDANVMLHPHTLKNLARHFSNPEIGLVDTRLKTFERKNTGIYYEETKYTTQEFWIKYREGLLWQLIMGPSGACYALRKSLFYPIPSTFLVDDFFLAMHTLSHGKQAIADPHAVVFEDAVINLKEAFRRKVRIAAGNFQNLRYFRQMLCNIFSRKSRIFWSHKGLRWLGPLFLLISLVTNIFLASLSPLYMTLLFVQLFFLFLIFPDTILVKFNKHIVILRFVTHFYLMNLALLVGLIKFLKGIKTNVWEPTQRNTPA